MKQPYYKAKKLKNSIKLTFDKDFEMDYEHVWDLLVKALMSHEDVETKYNKHEDSLLFNKKITVEIK